MQTEALYILHNYTDEDYKKNMIFHAGAGILRLLVPICYINKCWQHIIDRFC